MQAFLISFLNTQAGQDLLVGIGTSLVAIGVRIAEKAMLANKHTDAAAILPEIAGRAIDDAIQAAAKAPPEQRMQLAIAAARAELVADYPAMAKSISGGVAENLTALVAGHVAMQTIATAPGDSTVNLPSPIPIGGKP